MCDEFVDLFENSNFNNLEKLIENFYSGDVYSIKNSFSLKFIEKIKSYLINNFKETNSEFYKIKEGCPNFHRVVGEKEKFKYKLKSNRHDYYFFPWNRSKEKIDLFHYFYPKWRLIKLLSGLKSNEYEKNTPKDGVVDRLLFRTYPNKSGYLQPHTDPPIIRIISGLTMSKKGIDFDTGGIYFFRNNKPFDIESFFEVGDISLFYQTMKHGVEKILTNTKITKTASPIPIRIKSKSILQL